VAQVIEDLRHALVTPRVPWMEQIVEGPLYLVPLALTIVSVVVGVLVFNRLSPRFAEEL
jgi:ABC-type polysaccharide/polyol phosphate export permease